MPWVGGCLTPAQPTPAHPSLPSALSCAWGDTRVALRSLWLLSKNQSRNASQHPNGSEICTETATPFPPPPLLRVQVRKENPTLPLPDVVREVLAQVEGAYGVCFLFADQPDLLIGARKGSPLILGIGHAEDSAVEETKEEAVIPSKGLVRECFMASDASAIIEYVLGRHLGGCGPTSGHVAPTQPAQQAHTHHTTARLPPVHHIHVCTVVTCVHPSSLSLSLLLLLLLQVHQQGCVPGGG